ncbi:HAD-like protein [Auriscalpium vulgare]|uniref:HAD-like protein n=1 Tax=Auriscalpium vulgare TaxID=40419 RepID=A0ACB8RTX0_9AGAM|nr:HAD-like protein [Auriscalpium vulgare]
MSSSSIPRCTTLVFDIGDVLFSWSPVTSTSISPRTLKAILSSPTWHLYECGGISEDDCYRLVGEEFSLASSEVRQAFLDARDSLQPDNAFLEFIRGLQAESGGQLRIFAMSNISAPDYEVLRTKPADWGIFQRVFTSAAAGMRKPNLGFYKYVLEEIKADPATVVFVDDKPENVLSARSLGIHGVVFDDPTKVRQALRYLVCDPVTRGRDFLAAHAGELESKTDTGIEVGENFAQLLILEATRDRKLVKYVQHPYKWNFFREQPTLTTEKFPCDLDTTSIGLVVTQPDDEVFNAVMDEMLQNLNADRIPQVYFDPQRPRIDPIVCVNILSLFYSRERGSELPETLDWVVNVLQHRAYLEGTRYYPTAECFLYFLSRLLQVSPDEQLHARVRPLLVARLRERIGAAGDALALAMRIVACAAVGVRDETDLAQLLPLQWEDGGWEASGVYKYGSSGVVLGNRGLTTAYAINAIEAVEGRREKVRARPPPIRLDPSVRAAASPPSPKRRSPTTRRFSAGSLAKNFRAYLFPDGSALRRSLHENRAQVVGL